MSLLSLSLTTPGVGLGVLKGTQQLNNAIPATKKGYRRNRLPGGGGVSGEPAKHWAMFILCNALSPMTESEVSWILRVCVTPRKMTLSAALLV
ncbi:MAG: hypothetical protein V1269_12630 [Deltaproteobacteria bacterium]|nr:hypothetical protein [Deltaproteobacteria bacterium]